MQLYSMEKYRNIKAVKIDTTKENIKHLLKTHTKIKEVSALTLIDLYHIADSNNISVYHFPLYPLKSISTPENIGIDVEQINTSLEEKECLAHELGHCMNYAFYTSSSPYELRSQKEYRATKWAIERLVPFHLLVRAMRKGIATSWELAEYFDVSEALINKAIELYSEKLISMNFNI